MSTRQVTVAPVLTRHRAALLAQTVNDLLELPFASTDDSLFDVDLAHGFYQVPIPSTEDYQPSEPPPCISDSDSDSDSDYYYQSSHALTMPNVFSSVLDETVTYAKWKPCGNGMPGTMSCGKITVETLELAKRDLRIFLTNNRKLAPSDYVVRCLNVWEDPRVSNWIDQHRDEFSALSFSEFFTAVRDRVLEPDWQDSTFRKMRAVHMPESLNTLISDLAVQLLVLNNLLQGTPRFQSEDNLKIMLIDACDTNLREAYNKEVEDHAANPLHGIHAKDFHTFTKAIQMAEHMMRSRPTSRSTTPMGSSSTGAQVRRTNTASTSTNLGKLPPLTTNERRLLGDNEGCFKCRSFFVKCRTSSAEHEFPLPSGHNYKELTMTDVDAARKLRGPIMESNKRPRTGPIASITTVDDKEDDAVTSIMPIAVLGNGTDSEEEI
ncbi:hypothetical protein F5051DRAFT_432841 [Lentinula edodes]|nr:hypothetical protein F5051DRAFT_432841 [Lentinula edodes]